MHLFVSSFIPSILLALEFLHLALAGDLSNVLVKQGYKLIPTTIPGSPGSSKLLSGGYLAGTSYYSGGECSSRKYVEKCDDVSGTRYNEKDGLDGTYVIYGDTVTHCQRERSEWSCIQCTTFGGCRNSNGVNYSGSRTTYKLVATPGEVVALNYIDKNNECYKVCTNTDGTLAIGGDDEDRAECDMGDGWYLVDTTYDTACDMTPTFECKAEGYRCQGFSLSKGWMDDCCPGMYCGYNDRCRVDVYNDRNCTANYQPCSVDSDCCVGMECRDFAVNYAAKGCRKKDENCRQESYTKDDDESCCEGTAVAQYIDPDDGDVRDYCKATQQGIQDHQGSDPNTSGPADQQESEPNKSDSSGDPNDSTSSFFCHKEVVSLIMACTITLTVYYVM